MIVMSSTRIFPKGFIGKFISAFEYTWGFNLGIMFEWGGYEQHDVMLNIGFLFGECYITFNKEISTVDVKRWMEWEQEKFNIKDKQRTFGFMFDRSSLQIGHWKPGNWIEWETSKTYFFSSIKDNILGKQSLEKWWWKELEGTIVLPMLNDNTKTEEIERKAVHEEYIWTRERFPFLKKKRKYTEIQTSLPIPGKGTCSYNCWDDFLMGLSMDGFQNAHKIKAYLANQAYYYRSYYPL